MIILVIVRKGGNSCGNLSHPEGVGGASTGMKEKLEKGGAY